MNFWKEIIQEFIFQYRVFLKSIVSHPFLKHFAIIVSTKSWTPPPTDWTEGALFINKWGDRWGGGGGTLQTDAAQHYLFVPIPAKAKELGLLSIYKFSLIKTIPVTEFIDPVLDLFSRKLRSINSGTGVFQSIYRTGTVWYCTKAHSYRCLGVSHRYLYF
jgi:hypothetical protein